MLAEKLNMAPEEAERWIVNLIRNAHLDAKIDSKLVSMHYAVHLQLTFPVINNSRLLLKNFQSSLAFIIHMLL